MYYVYILQNESQDLYFGSTDNLKRRLEEHQTGKSRYTKGTIWELIYYEAYKAESDARTREQKLKLHGQAKAHLKKRILGSRQE